VTTRAEPAGGEPHHEAGGLGLGLFIAKTLLERSGATLNLANREPPAKGAVVRIAWPRVLMDMSLAGPPQPETMSGDPPWRGTADTL
jgi:two-component system sensor histidine kinase RegB